MAWTRHLTEPKRSNRSLHTESPSFLVTSLPKYSQMTCRRSALPVRSPDGPGSVASLCIYSCPKLAPSVLSVLS